MISEQLMEIRLDIKEKNIHIKYGKLENPTVSRLMKVNGMLMELKREEL